MNLYKFSLFPFTFVSEPLAEACHARFGPIVVYQPVAGQTPAAMEKLAAAGMITLRFPVSGEDERLAALAGSYRDWGEIYRKDAAVMKRISDTGFFHKEFVPEISTEIRKGPKPEAPAPDPVFAARLFLLLAQSYDRQSAELARDLAATEQAEKEMFARIRGGASDNSRFSATAGSGRKPGGRDPGAYMTDSRIDAWLRLQEADSEPPPHLITTSEAVVASLAERKEGLRAVGDPDDGLSADFYEIGDTGRLVCLFRRAG